jgi:hypothetical protein
MGWKLLRKGVAWQGLTVAAQGHSLADYQHVDRGKEII